MKFRTKFLILFIISILIQGSAVGYFSYYYAKNIASMSRKENIANMINIIDININTRIRYIDKIINDLDKTELIEATLYPNDDLENIKENIEIITDYLNLTIGNVNSFILMKDEKLFYKNSNFNSVTEFKTKHFLDQSILNKINNNPNKLYWSGVSGPFVSYTSKDEEIILMAYGLGNGINIAIELKTDTFNNLIPLAQDIFKDQYIFIMDKNKNIVSSNKSINKEWLNIIKELQFNNYSKNIKLEEEDYFIKTQNNGLTGWKTYALVSNNRIFQQNDILKHFIIYFVLLSVIVFSIMAFLISYGLTKPLARLSRSMELAEKENKFEKLENIKKDEIGKLTKSFNGLIEEIDRLVNEVYISNITQKNAEIEALEAQINPHFLYNTLDSINWMLLEKEEYDISDIIISLGDILKYSINKNNGIVTLEEELKYINSYLIIQKNRFEDKLKYYIDVPEYMRNAKIPKLILQPIVENSIIHSVDSKNFDININIIIKAYLKEDNIYIEIIDNGSGIEDIKLGKINKYLKDNINKFDSIGLENVNKRIKLYFGNKYGLKIFSKLGKGTKVIITIPQEGDIVNDKYGSDR